ncbi:hypothetical protein HY629_01600, partial [Candidatus Uhrbacteria bacterium]|nr:hypothetical protein [Candidatus Uhrbacteria bacterium]
MKVLYSSLIIASFLMVFFASTGFAASSSGMKAPQQPPQHLLLPSNKLLSPPEFELQKKKMLEQAIAKRKKLGFPVDPERTRVMKAEEWQHYVPERKYTKQSCYHVAYTKDPDDRVFCNAERCTFANGQYCEQKSRDCYDEDGTLILDEKGLPAIDNEQNLFLKWDLCLTHDGAPQPPPGEKPYDERIQTGCAYRVGKRTHPYYDGYRGYLMTCDAGRCLFHPGGAYNRETKMFTDGIVGETKTPPVEYWPYLEWKCIPPKAVHRIAKKYRCSIVTENDENWGCAVSFENGQHVYRSCKNNYNEKGEIVGTRVRVSDALLEQLEALPPFRDRQMEKDRPNRSIMNAVTDLEIFFHQTSVSDAAQEKVVVLFENFFNRHNDE